MTMDQAIALEPRTGLAQTGDADQVQELLNKGMYSCPGCMSALAMRHVLRVLGPNTVLALTTGCWAVIDGPFPYSASKIPLLHGAFGTAASMATGLRAAFDILGREDVQVLAWGGDGATVDIGMTSLSAAAARNENVIYVCIDNEAYMNTGVQRSGATPPEVSTTTNVGPGMGKRGKKNIVEIMASHEIPFAATASIGYLDDLIDKVREAKAMSGFRFLHIHTPCPTGWWLQPEQIVHVARLAVQARVQPLYRVYDGQRWVLDWNPPQIPVTDYFQPQKRRIRGLSAADLATIQAELDRKWLTLQARASGGW
jgi:pyruvate/2-oxoacid:ferredoxin oxidoreductase beta subunit